MDGKEKGRMKVLIVGAGRVGASVAFALIQKGRHIVERLDIWEVDRQRMMGEIYDLRDAAIISKSGITVGVGEKNRRYDIVIVCAGRSRRFIGESDSDLFNDNKNIVMGIARKFIGRKFLIVTNPPERLSRIAGRLVNAEPMGKMLDEARRIQGRKDSSHILRNKGYTNWGIAAEVVRELWGFRA